MKNEPTCTGPFRGLIPQFILFKRGQGYDYGYAIQMRLREIDLFMQRNGVSEPVITEEMHERWCARRGGEKPSNQARRIGVLCAFERWLVEQMNLRGVFLDRTRRKYWRTSFIPYIFSSEDIASSFGTMDGGGIGRPADMRTLAAMFALYYGCGLRKSEAQKLRLRDIDFSSGKIRILDGKNHESRIVVASASVMRRLERYRLDYPSEDSMPFFHRANGSAFNDGILYTLFSAVMEHAGIRRPDNGRTPRIHDLRHTYAVRALEQMERKGFDLYVALPLLSRSLGHRHITETEYYLRLREEHFASILDKVKAHSPALPSMPIATEDAK